MALDANPLTLNAYHHIKTERGLDSPWNAPAATRSTGGASTRLNPAATVAGSLHRGWHSIPHPLSSPEMLRAGFKVLMDEKPAPIGFFASARHDLVHNPCLEVPPVGPVGIPISPLVTDAIVKHCRTLPSGGSFVQGVGPGVCELDPGQFELRNPQWFIQARVIMKELLEKMFPDKSSLQMKMELDKCLVIPPGACFLQTQRQETTESVFGTMAICLPSNHDGGDIAVSYRGMSKTLTPSNDPDFAFSCAAWSVFAEPVGQPVTSGHQIILTYKLIHHPTFVDLKSRHEGAGATSLTGLLRSWSNWAENKTTSFQSEGVPPKLWFSRTLDSTSGPRLPALYHRLENRLYTPELHFNHLTGRDKRQIADLRNACEASGCRVLLANLNQEIEGPVDDLRPTKRLPEGEFYNIGTIIYRDLSLLKVIDIDGSVLIHGHVASKDLCTYDVDLDLAGEPDEDAPLQQTSAGPRVGYQIYGHSIAVVVPDSFYFPFLLHAAGQSPKDRFIDNIKVVWDDLHGAFRANPEDQKLRNQMSELCRIVFEDQKWRKQILDEVIWVALEIGEFEVVKRALNSRGEQAEELAKRFGEVIYTRGIEQMQPVIDHIWRLISSSPMGHIMSLVQMRSTWTPPAAHHTPAKAIEWYESTLAMLFDRLEQKDPVYLDASAGSTLAHAVPHFPESFFDTRVVPFAKKVASNTPFSLALMTALFMMYERGEVGLPGSILEVYQDLIPAIFRDFTIFSRRFSRQPNWYRPEHFVNIYHVATLIKYTRTLGLDIAELLSILEEKIRESQKEQEIFMLFATPLLRIICQGLRKKHEGDVSAAVASEEAAFVIRVMKSYITPSSGPFPVTPPDWRQSIDNVNPSCCPDCAELRRFVEDPVEHQKDFCMVARRRLHIQSKLNRHLVYFTVPEGSPRTLRIIKTHDRNSELRNWWKETAARHRGVLESLNEEIKLRETIGETAYQDIYACIADPDAEPGQDPSQANNEHSTFEDLVRSNLQAQKRLRPPSPAPEPANPRKRGRGDDDDYWYYLENPSERFRPRP
ncbi:uncharacterized protein DSM5745_04481 [Aspergillus mulundensis]|uniref:Uncharacterized protein n=1 Tax=Aspergillus mulundensis TaxID=1810919 RepID=A0A3D8SCS8_9EURO|nr:hypothetical protein DSM5745_04481 [Aspergillus mulundensis]RDW84155.1 hypothetical protein DSM5745_04481 [Aspergillus mulundensis]